MKKFITSIWFLGFLISIPIILLIPDFIAKYNLELISKRANSTRFSYKTINYKDLNGDNVPEIVESFSYEIEGNTFLSIQYFSPDGGMYDQINFKGNFHEQMRKVFFSDLNRNGLIEIYGFTTIDDSLFLNISEPFSKQGNAPISFFVTRLNRSIHGTIEPVIGESSVYDIDDDGFQEIIFPLNAGFSLFPKCIYIFDFQTKLFYNSIITANNNVNLQFEDLNNDGKTEIIVDGTASFNVPDSMDIPLDDRGPYIKVFDKDLNFYFKPIALPKGIASRSETYVIDNKLYSLYYSRSAESPPLVLYKISSRGKLIDSLHFKIRNRVMGNWMVQSGLNKFWIYTQQNEVVEVDTSLTINKSIRINNDGNLTFSKLNDFNDDGIFEVLATNKDNGESIIFTDNFRRQYRLGNNLFFTSEAKLSKNTFYLFDDIYTYIFSFKKNPFYPFRLLIFMLIYSISVFLFWGLQKIQEVRLKEKYELQNQVRDMELKTMQSQMDPHFMFNAFTTMASLLKRGEKEDAYTAFMKFTKMIRANFDFAKNLTRPLKTEIEAVSNYLEINKMRFKEKLTYSISIDETVSLNMNIPKMMIQMHVENALKHGIAKSQKVGRIEIYIHKKNKNVEFIIQDNGIGRKKAAALKRPSTKQGIKMLQAIYESLNKKNKFKISQQFVDLTNENGNATGTRVKIFVPENLKE